MTFWENCTPDGNVFALRNLGHFPSVINLILCCLSSHYTTLVSCVFPSTTFHSWLSSLSSSSSPSATTPRFSRVSMAYDCLFFMVASICSHSTSSSSAPFKSLFTIPGTSLGESWLVSGICLLLVKEQTMTTKYNNYHKFNLITEHSNIFSKHKAQQSAVRSSEINRFSYQA